MSSLENSLCNLKSIKILHFVLYSRTDEIFRNMYNVTHNYYKIYNNNVKTIYYALDNTIENDYKIEDDILLIKGEEIFSNITYKTIKAFDFFKNEVDNYDYIVRSNISTIINFKVLLDYFMKNEIIYGGGSIMRLYMLDPKSGVIDSSLFGLIFVQGTCIILNKTIFKSFIENKEKIRFDLVDDLCIALFVKNNHNLDISSVKMQHIPNFNGAKDNIFHFIKNDIDNIVAYRNKNRFSETIDVLQMKHITDILLNNHIKYLLYKH